MRKFIREIGSILVVFGGIFLTVSLTLSFAEAFFDLIQDKELPKGKSLSERSNVYFLLLSFIAVGAYIHKNFPKEDK